MQRFGIETAKAINIGLLPLAKLHIGERTLGLKRRLALLHAVRDETVSVSLRGPAIGTHQQQRLAGRDLVTFLNPNLDQRPRLNGRQRKCAAGWHENA